jgi:hypothetical protein
MKNPTPSWNTLAARLSPPPVKVMGCLLELVPLRSSPAAACAAHDRDASRQDASRQSLQPTYCQRAPLKPTNSRARDSHLADHLSGNWLPPARSCWHRTQCREEGAPDSPKASPIPSSAADWRRCTGHDRRRSHLRGGRPVFSAGRQLSGGDVIPDREPSGAAVCTPCRAAPRGPAFAEPNRRRTEDPCRSSPPRAPLSRPEVPSIDRSFLPIPAGAEDRLLGRH